MPRLTIASGRPPWSTDRLGDAVYLVRAAGLNGDVVCSGGIEAVFSDGAATNEVVSSGGTAVTSGVTVCTLVSDGGVQQVMAQSSRRDRLGASLPRRAVSPARKSPVDPPRG
jgi:autotransporter passenger strand-loop-strand repeat protein